MLGDYLNSINYTKIDLVDKSDNPEQELKQYPMFPVSRTLSYFPECLFLVNEINIHGLKEFKIDNDMHYHFLLHVIPKGKRFTKWTRPPKYEYLDYLMKEYSCSKDVALGYLDLYTEEELNELAEKYFEGGKE